MNKPNPTESAEEIQRGLTRLTAAIDDPSARYGAVQGIAEQIAHEAARLAGGEFRPEYNGWTNRETWNTALWIRNDQGAEEEASEIVAERISDPTDPYEGAYPTANADQLRRGRIRAAADALQEWWSEYTDPAELAGPVSDAWGYALAVTDWYRIAEGYAEDME